MRHRTAGQQALTRIHVRVALLLDAIAARPKESTMPRTPEGAVAASLAQTRNVPDTCQLTVRTWLDAPSAGDRDHDGDADAYDGWLSEPIAARHLDRNPPAGYPVAWSGGNGHRALSLGPRRFLRLGLRKAVAIRSTDAGGSGITATVPLSWVEQNWGKTYLGWSTTIDGLPIPPNVSPAPPKPEPLDRPQRAKVIRRTARRVKAKHPKWAERLLAWAERIEKRAAK